MERAGSVDGTAHGLTASGPGALLAHHHGSWNDHAVPPRDATTERHGLCDDALAAGAEAPTLCEGWVVRDLLVHLVGRDGHRGAQALRAAPLEELVARVRSGPARLHPARLGPVDDLVNRAEFFVHREDVRRAQPGWEPRPLPAGESAALWRTVKLVARLAYRKAGVGVVLVTPDGPRAVVRSAPTAVSLTGEVGELVLHAFGRRSVARVEVAGTPAAVAAFEAAFPATR